MSSNGEQVKGFHPLPLLCRCFDTDTSAAIAQESFWQNLQTLQDLSAHPKSPVTYSSFERLNTDRLKQRRPHHEAPSMYSMPVTTQQVGCKQVAQCFLPALSVPRTGPRCLQAVGWHCLKRLTNSSDPRFPCHKTGEVHKVDRGSLAFLFQLAHIQGPRMLADVTIKEGRSVWDIAPMA